MNLKEIEARLAAIKQEMNNEGADLEALNKEVDDLIEQRNKIIAANESRSNLLAKIAAGEVGTPDNEASATLESGTPVESEVEKRSKEFAASNKMKIGAAESRSLLLSSGKIATPTKVSEFGETITGVSSIVDMVFVEDCTGMDSDIVPYEDTEAVASAKVEGSAAAESTGTFGTVTISPKLYSLISYVSKEIKNQTPVNYMTKVQNQAVRALRRKAAQVITEAVVGSTIKREVTDITAIGADTLRKIVFGHGSDETIEGSAVLFLNKADLVAFGDVRGTNEKKAVYEITPDGTNPNVGTIKDGGLTVKYCINSNCKALKDAKNTSAEATMPTMFYGNPKCIKLDLFGDYTVETDNGYKFAEGLISVLGSARCGADITVKNGITVVSLPKATG